MVEPLSEYDKERLDLGTQIRRLRKQAELTGTELGAKAGMSQSKVSKLETGRVTPTADDVERIVTALGLSGAVRTELVERASALAVEVNSWRFFNRHGIRKRQEEFHALERAASRIRLFQPLIVPGLLQTAEYIRQIMERATWADSAEVGPGIKARLERQSVIYDSSKEFTFVILESALRHRFGSIPGQIVQLDRISTVSTLRNVDIGIVPDTADLPRVPYSSFCVFDTDLVTAERQLDEIKETDPGRIAEYIREFDAFAAVASFGDAGRRVLRDIGLSLIEARDGENGHPQPSEHLSAGRAA